MTEKPSDNKSKLPLNMVLGVVAGDGYLPLAVVKAAKQQGVKTVVLALSTDAQKALKPFADVLYECAVGQLERAVKLFKQENVTVIQFAGTVPAMNLVFNMHKLDSTALNIVTKLPNLNNETLQRALGGFMESSGFRILEQSHFLVNSFPQGAVLSKRVPTDSEYLDIAFGLSEAQHIAQSNKGSLVVVQGGKVIAQDTVNGTDQTIRLALRKQAGGVLVCKVARCQQDLRFYIPSVGMGTLKALTKDGRRGNVLAVRAGETLPLDLDAMVNYCDRHDLSFVVLEGAANQADENAAPLLSEVT